MIDPKLAMQAHRNYETFKQACSVLASKNNLSEEEETNQYILAKAALYNIDIRDFEDDMIGLEQEIDKLESLERRISESQRNDYYSSVKI